MKLGWTDRCGTEPGTHPWDQDRPAIPASRQGTTHELLFLGHEHYHEPDRLEPETHLHALKDGAAGLLHVRKQGLEVQIRPAFASAWLSRSRGYRSARPATSASTGTSGRSNTEGHAGRPKQANRRPAGT